MVLMAESEKEKDFGILTKRFMKVYKKLPEAEKSNVCAVIVVLGLKQPITWNVAKLEISKTTRAGRQILEQLARLDII